MPTHKEIYDAHAEKYEALVSREDRKGNILKALRSILPLEGLDVVDLGAGTGRLAAMLARIARSVLAFDLSHHMLQVAARKLHQHRSDVQWIAAVGDHRWLPLRAESADLVVSGWSVSYVAVWHPESWRNELEAWLMETKRTLRPGGSIVLFESLGTGNEKPQKLPHLETFYDWLDETDFRQTWIRTDYRFDSIQEANDLTEFFFGHEMLSKISRSGSVTLPECTGVWWKRP